MVAYLRSSIVVFCFLFLATPVWVGAQSTIQKIIFESDRSSDGRRHLWMIDPEGGTPEQLTFDSRYDDGSPSVSPDGRWIAFQRLGQNNAPLSVWCMPFGGGEPVRLTDDKDDAGNIIYSSNSPDWHPTGDYLLVNRATPAAGGGHVPGSARVWVYKMVDGVPIEDPKKVETSYETLWPEWSTDGNAILSGVKVGGFNPFEIGKVLYSPGEDNPPPLTEIQVVPYVRGEYLPASSSDGRVAWMTFRDRSNGDIYVQQGMDTSTQLRLTPTLPSGLPSNAGFGHPAWAPDDQRIVASSCCDAPRNLWTIDPDDGGVISQLTFGSHTDIQADWVEINDSPEAFEARRDITVELPGGASMEFVWVEPGVFTMGTTEEQKTALINDGLWMADFQTELPAHEVAVKEGYYVGRFEITQEQWETVMGTTPWVGGSNVTIGPDIPATYISWHDVQGFIDALNQFHSDYKFHLPSEVEWEKAARGGTETLWSFGDDEDKLTKYAWYKDNAFDAGEPFPHEKGTKLTNPIGLFHIHGNVYEWCKDWHDQSPPYDYYQDLVDRYGEPVPSWAHVYADSANATSRVMRGGNFESTRAGATRSATRNATHPNARTFNIGARLVAKPVSPPPLEKIFVDAAPSVIGEDRDFAFATAWGDYDNDGYLDLFIGHDNGEANRLYDGAELKQATAGGGFAVDRAPELKVDDREVTSNVAWGDYDNDGYLDLFVGVRSSNSKLYRNTPSGSGSGRTFGEEASARNVDANKVANGISWGDYDNDGDIDLYIAQNASSPERLYRNDLTATGQFHDAIADENITQGAGEDFYGGTWVDYDNDGEMDLMVRSFTSSNNDSKIFLYTNEFIGGEPDFTRTHTFDVPRSDAGESGTITAYGVWGDHDNDGDLDLYASKVAGKPPFVPVRGQSLNLFFRNDGGSQFTEAAECLYIAGQNNSNGVAWGDYNNDGDLDLYVSNSTEGPPQANNFYENVGSGQGYVDVAGQYEFMMDDLAESRNGGWADFDVDGDLDFYLTNVRADDRLFVNEGDYDHNWIQIDLEGTMDNAAGIGARVVVHASDDRTHTRVMNGGGYGHGSQDALRLHFGLGVATVDHVEVFWPRQGADRPQIVDGTALALNDTNTIRQPVPDLQIEGRIAFQTLRDGNGEIYVMDDKGVVQTNLTDHPANDASPGWSGTGDRLAFQTNRTGNNEVYEMAAADGTQLVNRTNNPASDTNPRWSPDDQQRVFVSKRDGFDEIYTVDAAGTVTRLTDSTDNNSHPHWSPYGDKIVFHSTIDGDSEIYVVDLLKEKGEEGRLIQLTDNAITDAHPYWSPDGSRIVFDSNRDGNYNIYYMDAADGGNPTRITSHSADDEDPSWSPDGQRIVFYSFRDGNPELYTVEVDGSNPMRLTVGPAADVGPAWEQFRHIGLAPVGGEAAKTMRVRNAGNGDLIIDAISFSKPEFSIATPLPLVVGPEQTEEVEVRFSPQTSGGVFATMTIESNESHNGGVVDLIVNGLSNRPPVADAGEDAVIDCALPSGTNVELDASGSSDPDGDPLIYTWRENGEIIAGPTTDPVVTVHLSLGDHPIELEVDDDNGGVDPDDVVITVVEDTEPPVITLNGDALVILECNVDDYEELGATAEDDCDDDPELTLPTELVDPGTPGDYVLTYTATDDNGNTSATTRIVRVVDTTPPAIALNGDNPLVLECPAPYVELGATAVDACDENPQLTIEPDLPVPLVPGEYTVTYRAVDASDNKTIATRAVQVVDTTPPVLTLVGAGEIAIECSADYADEGATAVDDCDGDLTAEVAVTNPVDPDVPGEYTVVYNVTDAAGNAAVPVSRKVTVVDTTPPDLTLEGDDPILIELGSPYVDPGATAIDLCDGDMTDQIAVANPVDVHSEGEYTVTYDVSDDAGNPATLTRTVAVVVTPNSYVLIAANSMQLKEHATVHSGLTGVVDYGQRPFLADRAELSIGARAFTDDGVRVSAPRVRVRSRATIAGTLVYDRLKKGSRVTIGQEVTPGQWPLFAKFGLPPFIDGMSGAVDVNVKKKKIVMLAPEDGPFGEIKVRQKGTLILTGGEYHIEELDIGPKAAVLVQAPTTLLIDGHFALDQRSYFGPESAAVDPADILIYVEGENGRPKKPKRKDDDDDDDDDDGGGGQGDSRLHANPRAVKIGVMSIFAGNVYAPNGTIYLRQQSQSTGSFIGRDVLVGVKAEVQLRSGWTMPGVVYEPPLVAAKLAAMPPDGSIGMIVDNYPNPFNPATTIRYLLPEFGRVKLTVYNALGQEVKTLVDQPQPAGLYRAEWDGRDRSGYPASSGVYFYRLTSDGQIETGRMLLIK